MTPYQGFVGGAYRARSSNFDAEECLNLYAEVAQGNARNVAALYGTPGLRTWLELSGGSTSGVRGCIKTTATTSYWVVGENVYKVLADKTTTLLGSISAGSMPVSMASNGIDVVIAVTPNMWKVDPTGAVTAIAGGGFLGASQVGFIGGYFIWTVPNSGRAQYSSLYSTDTTALNFFTAEGSPDNGVGQIVDHLEYWYFNETTTEVYGLVADANNPIQRIGGAFIEHGCASAYSIAKMDNTIYWLGSDENGLGIVWKASGAYEPQRVSTHAIEFALAQADLSTAVAWTYQQEGHAFYVLTVGDKTWVFDAATGLWHQRAWRNPATAEFHRHRGQCRLSFAGKTLVGDWENGKIYEMGLDIYDDDGVPLIARRTGPSMNFNTYSGLRVHFESGVGLQSGQGEDPQAMLQWSDSYGKYWSAEYWAAMGRVGDYKRRVDWRRLGSPRPAGTPRIFRVTISDPVKRAIISAEVDGS